jgi:hypothetical protein
MKHHPARHESQAAAAAAPTSPSNKTDLPSGRPLWDSVLIPLVLAAFGTAGLFIAWHSQYLTLAAATDTRMTLQRSQLVINLWEAKRDQWVIAMNQELSKTAPNRAWLARTLAETNKATIMWQGYMKLRIEKSEKGREQILADRNRLLDGIDALLMKLDTEGLEDVYTANVAVFNASRSLESLDQQFFAISDEGIAAERTAENRMAAAYMIGTGLMLLSTIVAGIQQTRAFSLLQKQQAAKKMVPSNG